MLTALGPEEGILIRALHAGGSLGCWSDSGRGQAAVGDEA